MSAVSSPTGLTAVVLAAGLSRRLGYPKQLCRLEGETLLLRTLLCLQQPAVDRIMIVTGAYRDRVWAEASSFDAKLVQEIYHPGFAAGMGSSIAAAAQWLLAHAPSLKAALLCSCDQIGLGPEFIRTLIDRSLSSPPQEGDVDGLLYTLSAASYGGSCGIPALFPRHYLPTLAGLHGEKGAKPLLLAAVELRLCVFAGGSIDIDTDAERQRFGLDLPLGIDPKPEEIQG